MNINSNALNAYQPWHNNSATNTANTHKDNQSHIQTNLTSEGGSVKATSTIEPGSVNLVKESVDSIQIENGVEANVTSIETQDALIGSLLNILA
jgi:flagellar basal body rod protein FlgC